MIHIHKGIHCFFILIVLLLSISSCKQTDGEEKKEKEFVYEKKTVWKEKDMTFQMTYCQRIMGKVNHLDLDGYCECFLNEIKYYYKPIDVLDAYRQEHDFSKKCMEAHYDKEAAEAAKAAEEEN